MDINGFKYQKCLKLLLKRGGNCKEFFDKSTGLCSIYIDAYQDTVGTKNQNCGNYRLVASYLKYIWRTNIMVDLEFFFQICDLLSFVGFLLVLFHRSLKFLASSINNLYQSTAIDIYRRWISISDTTR